VPAVGELVVEDDLEGFGGFALKAVGADVDGAVGVGAEDVEARTSKGRNTVTM
jgi:hypothetical protein